jgi:hypothetical protein
VSTEKEVVAELLRLRRSWGLQNRDLRKRTGPVLMRLCGIVETDGDREIRDKVRALLHTLVAELPPELARAALVAFALDRAHQHRQLTKRIESLAGEQSWAPRTTRRRMDHAVRLMAQATLRHPAAGTAARTEPAGGAGVDTVTLAAVVRLCAAGTDAEDPGVVVLRVAVPPDRFDLLIRFDATEPVPGGGQAA